MSAPRGPGPTFRVSPKAIIIEDGRILMLRMEDGRGDFYLLPGGGQRHGETVTAALHRECREEIGADVEIGRLVLVRDYIGAHHEFAGADGHAHQVELMFVCRLAPGSRPMLGPEPDGGQRGVAWLPLGELASHRIYPAALAEVLPNDLGDGARYLGDVN